MNDVILFFHIHTHARTHARAHAHTHTHTGTHTNAYKCQKQPHMHQILPVFNNEAINVSYSPSIEAINKQPITHTVRRVRVCIVRIKHNLDYEVLM